MDGTLGKRRDSTDSLKFGKAGLPSWGSIFMPFDKFWYALFRVITWSLSSICCWTNVQGTLKFTSFFCIIKEITDEYNIPGADYDDPALLGAGSSDQSDRSIRRLYGSRDGPSNPSEWRGSCFVFALAVVLCFACCLVGSWVVLLCGRLVLLFRSESQALSSHGLPLASDGICYVATPFAVAMFTRPHLLLWWMFTWPHLFCCGNVLARLCDCYNRWIDLWFLRWISGVLIVFGGEDGTFCTEWGALLPHGQ